MSLSYKNSNFDACVKVLAVRANFILGAYFLVTSVNHAAARKYHGAEGKLDIDSELELEVVHDARLNLLEALLFAYIGNCTAVHDHTRRTHRPRVTHYLDLPKYPRECPQRSITISSSTTQIT